MKLFCKNSLECEIDCCIQELLDINIREPRFSDTVCSIDDIYYPDPYDKYYTITTGMVGINCNGYLLCWLTYKFEYDQLLYELDLDEVSYAKCQIKIKKIFSDNFELLGIKSPILD